MTMRWAALAAVLLVGCAMDRSAPPDAGDVDAAQDCSRCALTCSWNATDGYHSTCTGTACPAECHPLCLTSFVECGGSHVTTCSEMRDAPECSTRPTI